MGSIKVAGALAAALLRMIWRADVRSGWHRSKPVVCGRACTTYCVATTTSRSLACIPVGLYFRFGWVRLLLLLRSHMVPPLLLVLAVHTVLLRVLAVVRCQYPSCSTVAIVVASCRPGPHSRRGWLCLIYGGGVCTVRGRNWLYKKSHVQEEKNRSSGMGGAVVNKN